MEEISSLVWIGIAVLWFLTRLARRGVKKATQSRKRKVRETPAQSTAPTAGGPRARFGDQPSLTGRGGQGPPPIVPR